MTNSSSKPDMKSGKDGSCPVCGRMHDQDCHWYSDNKTVLCYTKGTGGTSSVPCPPDSVPAAIGGNYVFKEMSSDGRAGIYSLRVEQEVKANRPKSKTDYFYQNARGQDVVKVTRTDRGDGNKVFSQTYFDPEAGAWEQWINTGKNPKGNIIWKSSFSDEQKDGLKAQVPLYNLPTVMAAIADGKDVWFVEGEGCVDVLAKIDIVATTLIAGAGKLKAYNPRAVEALSNARVILCPDRDQKGLAHMEEIAAALKGKATVLWCYCKPELSAFWINLQKDGGLDCKDWLDELGSLDSDKKRAVLYDAVGAAKKWESTKTAAKGMPSAPSVKVPVLDMGEIKSQLKDLSEQSLSSSELKFAILGLSRSSGFSPSDIRKIYDDLVSENDRKETKRDIISLEAKVFDVSDFLPEQLAIQIKAKAASLCLDPVYLFQYLLPCVASLLGSKVDLRVKDKWKEKAIIWNIIIAMSGDGKSRASDEMWEWFITKQREDNEQYKLDKQNYRRDVARQAKMNKEELRHEPELVEPQPRKVRFYTTVQVETLLRKAAQQAIGSGAFIGYDELAGWFHSMNAYRKGVGSDLEQYLSLFGGSDVPVDRSDEDRDFLLQAPRISIAGGLQPKVAEDMFATEDDSNGFRSRFRFVIPNYVYETLDTPDHDLQPYLNALYSGIENLPVQTIGLSEGADKMYRKFYEDISQERKNTANGAKSNFLGKSKTYVPRFALVLHCIEFICAPSGMDFVVVSEETMARAIALERYYISQLDLLQAKTCTSGNPENDVLTQIDLACRSQDGLTVRDIYRGIYALTRMAKAEEQKVGDFTLSLVNELVASGHGEIIRESKRSPRYRSFQAPPSAGLAQTAVDYSKLEAQTTSPQPEPVADVSPAVNDAAVPTVEVVSSVADVDQPVILEHDGFKVGDRVVVTEGEYAKATPDIVSILRAADGSILFRVSRRSSSGRSSPADFDAEIPASHVKAWSVTDRRSQF